MRKFNLCKEVQGISAATHNGVAHADEITAFALLSAFSGSFLEPTRVAHQTSQEELKEYDYVIDIGRKFDGVQFFDHHQYEGGKSSAGLIWDHIQEQIGFGLYPEVDMLVTMVDEHDTGERKTGRFEFPSILASYNSQDIYGEEQDDAFRAALEFATHFILSLKDEQDRLAESKTQVATSVIIEELQDILEMPQFISQWNEFVNGEETPEIGAVMWFDPQQGLWKAQVTPKAKGSFEFQGRKFLPRDDMDFVHAAGFFAVAKTRELMIDFLANNRE